MNLRDKKKKRKVRDGQQAKQELGDEKERDDGRNRAKPCSDTMKIFGEEFSDILLSINSTHLYRKRNYLR